MFASPLDLSEPDSFGQGIPHDAFAQMRAAPGLTWNEAGPSGGFWSVTRHAEVVDVSRDPTTYSSAAQHIQLWDIDEDALDSRASMIDMDPPAHTRLRRVVSSAFTPRKTRGYEGAVRHRTGKLLDRLMADGGGDWVEMVARPIPTGVICEIMGVPEADQKYVVQLADYLVESASGNELAPDAFGNSTELRLLPFGSPAAHGMSEYARRLGAERRASPTDDLVSRLISAEAGGDRLTDNEFTNFFRLMIFAGNETTRTAMSHLAVLLAEHRGQFAEIRGDGDAIGRAVEELLRWSSPILYFRRTATCSAVLAGTEIAEGDRVVMWYASANYDESVFDTPLNFDVKRDPNQELAFGGGGPHFCLGAFLARLELTVLIEEVLERDMHLELTAPPELLRSNFVNGIERLKVAIV